VKMDIRKLLLRVTLDMGDEATEKMKWCRRLVYEYLTDFCYICGLIRHNR
jgi:hypothetical protein